MIGIGAIVKSIAKALDRVELGLRLALRDRRLKPCPVPIPAQGRRRRR